MMTETLKEQLYEYFIHIRWCFEFHINGIKNLIKWRKIIYRNNYFDYKYIIDILEFQLNETANHFESEKANCSISKQNAKRIRTIIKLMNKTYNEYYALEYQDILEKKYGKSEIKFIPEEKGKLYKIKKIYPNQPEELWEQIEEEYQQEFLKSMNKQEKAHKILWKLFEHNIRNFWD